MRWDKKDEDISQTVNNIIHLVFSHSGTQKRGTTKMIFSHFIFFPCSFS